MTMEEEGVEINMVLEDCPAGLVGVRIGNQTFMIDQETMTVKLTADPVWSLDGLIRKENQDGGQLSFWED